MPMLPAPIVPARECIIEIDAFVPRRDPCGHVRARMRYLSNALPLLHPLGGHRSCGRADRHPPCAAVALEQFVGFFGPSAAGPVALEAVAGGVFPGVEKGLHRAPAGLDAVGALK